MFRIGGAKRVVIELRFPDPRRKNIAELSSDGNPEIRTKDISMKGRLDAATGRGEGKYRDQDFSKCNRMFELSRE